MNQQAESKVYYYSLDLLRFGAALLVTFFHLGFSSWVNKNSGASDIVDGLYKIPQAADYTWFGWVGVQIFFVISGFVIANSAHGASPFRFLRGRIERLYPAVWICASLTALVWALSGVMDASEIGQRYIGSMTLWPWGPWIDGQYWTLSCEIVFYALVFGLLAFGKFHRLEWLAAGLVAVGSIFIAVFAANELGWIALDGLGAFTKGGLRPFPFYYGEFFGLGILLWLLTQNRLTNLGKVATAFALVSGSVQIGLGAFTAVNLADRAQFGLQDRWLLPVVAWLAACTVIALSKYMAKMTVGWRPSALRIIRVLGLMTYPQYLLHFALGVSMMRTLVEAGVTPVLAMFIAVAAIMVLSCLIALYGEAIVRRNLRKVLPRVLPDDPLWAKPLRSFAATSTSTADDNPLPTSPVSPQQRAGFDADA